MSNPIRKLKKRIKSTLAEWQLRYSIRSKWRTDSQALPLTPLHRGLYDQLHRRFWNELRDLPNLIDCRDYNDRIQWLKLFDNRRETVQCSDKILARDYMRERVGEAYLVPLLQVCDHYDEIDFATLPNAFVIKANHDSGTVIVVRDATKFDSEAAREKIESALVMPYGWENGEWAYSFVQPRILVEEIIESEGVGAISDYKFHCVDGKVRWLQYIFDRGENTKECIVAPDGAIMQIHLDQAMEHSQEFIIPPCWDELISVAEKLAREFKYVRVDLFVSGDRIFVGELTFFPAYGCYQSEGQRELGTQLDFDRTNFRPCLIGDLGERRRGPT